MKDLSLKETAKQIGVSVMTIRRWINTGYLKAYKLNKYWKVKQSTIDELKQGGK